MQIREFLSSDIAAVKSFTDEQIGQGYYSLEELIASQKKSMGPNGEISSFVLVDSVNHTIKGLRLAFQPGQWAHGKGAKLRPDLWPFSLHEAGYFQSLFVASELQGQNWGPRLSQKSIEVFKNVGANGIITHCWKESPNNSSFRYLQKIGFTVIIEHPLYWSDIKYICTRDGTPCQCTSIEMYLKI
ncbi:MAG: GNAT family N-acetyltransferase [Bdellovibrionaceae bacterium]|nr:GNAT family N-acetyltransferase [Bdellovibrio sp.]